MAYVNIKDAIIENMILFGQNHSKDCNHCDYQEFIPKKDIAHFYKIGDWI